jgi:hypothetical protein
MIFHLELVEIKSNVSDQVILFTAITIFMLIFYCYLEDVVGREEPGKAITRLLLNRAQFSRVIGKGGMFLQ